MNEIFSLAKRDNNPRRNYLIVNKAQSKHTPSDPRDTVKLCTEMGEEMRKIYPNGECLAIAFAETAVGIGALAASALGERCFLMSTTREQLPKYRTFISFEESHSHAPVHKLCERGDIDYGRFGHVFIIDDELTTGNTVKAIAKHIREMCTAKISVHVFAASRESIAALGDMRLIRVTRDKCIFHMLGEKLPDFCLLRMKQILKSIGTVPVGRTRSSTMHPEV